MNLKREQQIVIDTSTKIKSGTAEKGAGGL